MWFKKFFLLGLLVCGFFSHNLLAEDNNSLEFEILKYNQYAKTVGDASKFIFEAGQSLNLSNSSLENGILNKLLSRQIESYQYMNELDIKYAKLVKEGYRQPYELSQIRRNKVEILDYIKDKRKEYTTKDISLFQLSDGVKKFLGVSLDVIGIGLDAYSFNQNINKLIDEDGNVLVNSLGISQNVYGLISGSVSLLGKVAGEGVIASSKFGQFFLDSSKGFNRTNYIVMTLQLNSVAYSYFRNKEINTTKEYAIKEYKSILGFRKDIYNKLLTAYTNDSNITRGEIGTILAHYPIFRPNNSGFLETIVLSQVFHKSIMNSTYLENRFDITNEKDLTGKQRVIVALDALADISWHEDDDFTRRLTKMIDAFPDDNWLAGLENAVAGAFSGADAYKIFSIDDLKKKWIPSELVRDSNIDAYTFYRAMYSNIFRGDIASAWIQTANDIGKATSSLIETNTEQIDSTQPETLLLTLPNGATLKGYNTLNAPKDSTIKFQAGITAGSLRSCVAKAGEQATYKLWYLDVPDGGKRKSLDLAYDVASGVFSFVMPTDEIVITDIDYDMNVEPEYGNRVASCGVPTEWVSVEDGFDNEDGNTTTNPINLKNGLVAHYEFEGNANDSSGNNNNGIEHGGVSYADGVIGQAGSFDGVDDYVEVENHNLNISDAISVSLWRKSKNDTMLLQWGEACPDGNSNYKGTTLRMGIARYYELTNHPLNEDRDKFHVNINSENGNFYDPRIFSVSKEALIEDEYEHLLFVFNNKVLTLYKNGKVISQYHGADKGGSGNTETITLDEFKKIFISNATLKIGVNESYCGYNHEFNGFLNGELDDLRIYNRALNQSEIEALYKLGSGSTPQPQTTKLTLLKETQRDGSILTTPFTKEWHFNKELTDLTPSIIDNSYQNSITVSDLIKEGKILKVNLTPNSSKAFNKLTLQFKNSNGEIVKVSGSDTFWSLTKTNHAPRLADGQITQLVGSGSSYLDIETYDSDGDSVTLSVEDDAGGTVGVSGNRLSASFGDGKVVHTVKIGLSDGKEKVIKEFRVIDFSQNSIENFYSDVDSSSDYFYAIAFATLKGVVGGQIDPNDETKRIFRPDDEVSLAEALKMVINAQRKAGLIELTTADEYIRAYPQWAMKYYTFAREKGALDSVSENLATYYPTREEIAKLIVKTLELDRKIEPFGELNFAFSDEADFSDAQMRHYAEIAHVFGLFMLDDQANPQSRVSRGALAKVIQHIFMIPKAELVLDPSNVEQGEQSITATVSNVFAQDINQTTHELYDSSSEVNIALTSNTQRLSNPIDSQTLSIGENRIYAFVDNHGVRGVAEATVTIGFSDQDSDGIQDKDDQWSDDTRYAYDENGNGIPDILDLIYDLGDYNSSDTVTIGGKEVLVEDIVRNGGVASSPTEPVDENVAVVSLDGTAEFTNIQSALDSNRSKVFIKNGNYQLTRGLELTRDGVEVIGESVDGVVIEPADNNVCVDLFYVGANYVTVSDLTIRQNANCRFTAFVSAKHHHVTLKDSKIIGSDLGFAVYFAGPEHGMGQEALDMVESGSLDHHNRVVNNTITSNFEGDVLSFSLQKDGLVSSNTLNGGLIALFLDLNVTCENNTLNSPKRQGIFLSLPSYDVSIKGNTIIDPQSTGITVKLQTDHKDANGQPLLGLDYRSRGIRIEGNRIENARNHGIAINNLKASVIRENIIDSPDFSGIYLYYSDELYVAKNHITNAGMVASGEREALYAGWNTAWDSGIYLEQYVANSVVSLNTIESSNNLMQWGIAINHRWEGNHDNKIYWNHLLGAFQYEKVHVEPNTPNSKFDNELLERTGQDIWLQILGEGRVLVDDVEYNQSKQVSLSTIGRYTLEALSDENNTFIEWLEPSSCGTSAVCQVTNNTLVDAVALFEKKIRVESDGDGNLNEEDSNATNPNHPVVERNLDTDNGDGVSDEQDVNRINPNITEVVENFLALKSINDIYITENGTIAPISIEVNASKIEEVTYNVLSSSDLVAVSIVENKLTFVVASDRNGSATITLTAKMKDKQVTESFVVYVANSGAVIVDPAINIPREESGSFELTQGEVHIVAEQQNNGMQTYQITHNEQTTIIALNIVGIKPVIDAKGTVTITLPTSKKVVIRVEESGEVSFEIENAVLPAVKLPQGTKVTIENNRIEFDISMSNKLSF